VPKVNLEKKMVLIYVLNALQVNMRVVPDHWFVHHVLEDRRLKQAPLLVICVPKVNLELPVVLIHVLNALQVNMRVVPDH